MDIAKQHILQEEFTRAWLDNYRASGRDVFCKKSCSGCCSLAVHTTFPEAQNITSKLSTEQNAKLQEYIESLKDLTPELTELKSYLKLHRQQIGPCPFLDMHDSCSIYDHRPLSCRSLLSTRPPGWCTVDFSTLDEWDKQAYEGGLDKSVVAWPTHFVAATQDHARKLESDILNQMREQYGFNLAGNFPLLVWLAQQSNGDKSTESAERLQITLTENGLNSALLVTFSTKTSG